jgi:mycothiol synthase
MTDQLPTNILIRRPTVEDAQAVADLIVFLDLQDMGESDVTQEVILDDWKRSQFELEKDAWVAVVNAENSEASASIIGYEEVRNRDAHVYFMADGYVHSQYRGLGIGTALLQRVEGRVQEQMHLAPPDRDVYVRAGVSGVDLPGRQLLEGTGYAPRRYFWRMRIEMDQPPEPEPLPSGFSLRNFIPGKDERRVFDAFREAFRDHWGYAEWIYEDWAQRHFDDGFDPALWFLAFQGDELAGGALCKFHPDVLSNTQDGWVSQLAVRRPWRRIGLGYALLKLAFGEFYRRGVRRVALGVDASNPTGATHLYEKAGMHVAHGFIVYEKMLLKEESEE